LAVSLIFGSLASTVLTLIVVPGIYFLIRRPRDETDELVLETVSVEEKTVPPPVESAPAPTA